MGALYKECALSEYAGMQSVSHQLADRFQEREIDVLLIGPGTGDFENVLVNDIFPEHNVAVKSVVAFEPNPAHVPPLKQVMSKWNCTTEVHAEYFDETSNLAGKEFDVAIFVHSCYLMPESV